MENLRSEAMGIDWQAIHESIQTILVALADVVQSDCPSIRSRGGKTQTTRFPLFSYRVFEIPSQSDLDSVVVGMNFVPTSSGRDITICADLSGEETGQIWFELPEQTVPAVQERLLATAETLVRELSEQEDRILVALNQQKRASPRGIGTQDNGIGIVRKEYESHS